MKILLCIEKNDFFFPGFLDNFLCSHPQDWNTNIAITYKKKTVKDRILGFFWLANFFRFNGVLKLLSKTLRKSLQSSLNHFNSSNRVYRLKDIERKHNKKILEFEDINSPESLSIIREMNLDIIISFQAVIFHEDLLKIPKLCCLNKHASLLPKYRGVWPVFWGLLNKEKEYGYTIHEMTEKIDTGKIFYQEKVPYNSGDTVFSLYKKIFARLSRGLILTIKLAEYGKYKNYENSNDYYSFPKAADVDDFYRIGNKVV